MGSQQSRDDNSLRQGGTVDDGVTVINLDDILQRYDSGSKQITQGISRLLEANKNQDYNNDQKGVILLKQVFKKLDPAITYGATFRRQGQLELSFKYDTTKDVLLIKVIRAVALDAKSLRDSCTNVYIKVFMVHSSSDQEISSTSGTQPLHKTKTIQGTLAPEFHEIFAFPITDDALQNGNVVCQAWNADAMEKDELIGQVTISVSHLHLRQSKTDTGVYDLMTEVNHDVTGNLKVTMAYQLPNHLNVTVHGANQLDNQSGQHAPNPMVKLQVAGLKEIYKTKVHYNTDSPVWEETFQFSVRNEDLKRRQLIFHVIDFDDVEKNRSLGQAIINLGDLELGSDYHGELKLADLKSGRHIHSSQAQNVALQEFKQSLVAHALGKCPNFLFQNKSGTKIIHVHNTKLDSEVSLRVIDAVPVY